MKHIFQQGNKFQIGCNYWASHAGPDMWRDWDAEQVDRDFAVLATYELDCVRVFPTWRDFQPFIRHCGCMNDTVELRRGEMPRTGDFEEYSGVDPVMLERFHVLSQLALKHNLKLIVSLVTGWMSGRMFVPQAFEQSRLLTDPAVIHEEVRYVRTLVRSLKNEPAIIAWEPGNESNCMERVSDIQMWHWFDTICNAIRREDGSRPVFSGTNTRVGGSQIADMRECADVLNAHSYPAFSRFCRVDPIDTMRNSFQATFMNRCNCDIGHTDSFIEETGAFGPCQTSDETAGRHLQNQLWNAYAHDCRGLLWWCAFEQTHLDRTPYDWSSMERTMGLFYPDGTPKPYTEKFAQVSRKFVHPLPEYQREAVLLLSRDQDQWAAALMGFLLAKAAGFDVTFALAEDPLPDAKLYLLPSVVGFSSITAHSYNALLEKVAGGAALYCSADDSGIVPMAPFGVGIHTVADSKGPAVISGSGLNLTLNVPHELKLDADGAEILAVDADGAPAFVQADYGKGKCFFLNVPLETALAPKARLFDKDAAPYWNIYRMVMERSGVSAMRHILREDPRLTLTEHPVSGDEVLVIAVNNCPEKLEIPLNLKEGWQIAACPEVSGGCLSIAANDGVILRLERKPAL